MFGGFPTGGPMTMRGSLPSFQAAQQTPQWQQPLSPQTMAAMFPQFMQQLPQAPAYGNTAPNWLQYWPQAQGGPTGGLNPDGTLPTPTPPTGGTPTDPTKPKPEDLLPQYPYGWDIPSGGGM